MNNNETNYEFVNRDYDGVINGNEKKIQFYSRTFSTIYDKYKVWHYDQIMKKKISKEEDIKAYARVANMASIGVHNQEIIKRKLAKLQDQVEYLNLALEDERYLHVSVRLLKVAERARNSISGWWKDFVKNIPIVGKMYQQQVVAKDEPNDAKNNTINVDDVISPQAVEEMINAQFANDDNKEQEQENNSSEINREDTTYRFGRDELANMPGRIDIITPTYDNETNYEDNQAENNASNEVKNGIIPADLNTSLIIPNEFTVNFENNNNTNESAQQKSLENHDETTTSDSNNVTSKIDDQDTIAALEQYREILKRQIEKKKQMDLEKEKAQQEYEQAQEKNNKVRDENNYLKEMISSRLNTMERNLNEESQKTQEELNLMCDKTNKLNSNTSQLGQANESLKAMCDELNIGVQENISDNSKGRSK